MIVSELIEWLKTVPQDAAVQVLEHHSDHSYYLQGGTCHVVDFDLSGMYCNEGSSWMHGEHFELECYKGQHTLQLGVRDK